MRSSENEFFDLRVLLANGDLAGVTPAIFVIFVDFRGLRSKAPCFCGWNAILYHSMFSPFRQRKHLFSAGDK